MTIIIDTRERKIYHITRYFDEIKQPYIYEKLDFGDYSISGFESHFAIERKNGKQGFGGGWAELKGNICTKNGRVRFNDEFERALKFSAEIVLLIENANNINDCLNVPCQISALRYIPNTVFLLMIENFIQEQNDKRLKTGLNKIKIDFSDSSETGAKIIELCKNYINENNQQKLF